MRFDEYLLLGRAGAQCVKNSVEFQIRLVHTQTKNKTKFSKKKTDKNIKKKRL